MRIQPAPRLSHLRKRFIDLSPISAEESAVFLSDEALVKGTFYPLRRKCSKPGCRCARGALHETMVLTARVGGRTRLWSIPTEEREDIRLGTERYRRFREARVRLLKECDRRREEILGVVEEIERLRIREP
jgi:hypothetical protein